MFVKRAKPRKGRGAASNPDGRYLVERRVSVEDGWYSPNGEPPPLRTTVTAETARAIISRNQSPDVPFEQSINPYRGCEHGCAYCYARPTHAYLDLSPGLDFESRLFVKTNAAEVLERELSAPGYQCKLISLGANTDPYQPIERRWRITRRIIEVLFAHRHPLSIVTKSSLVERDIDLLASMAEEHLVEVHLSITTLDNELARKLEPRATAPKRRVETLLRLSDVGIPTGVLFAPVIPALNDSELEAVLESVAGVGGSYAGYVLLRLPREVKDLFEQWLKTHEPLKADRVMNRVKEMRGGLKNEASFGTRMRGTGIYAELIRRRFELACKSLGLNKSVRPLDCTKFKVPAKSGDQLSLL